MRSVRALAAVSAMAAAMSMVGCDGTPRGTDPPGARASDAGTQAAGRPGDSGAGSPRGPAAPPGEITGEQPSGAPGSVARGEDIDEDADIDLAIRDRGQRLGPVPRDLDGDGEPDVRLSDGSELELGRGGLSIMHAVDAGADEEEPGEPEPEREPVAGEIEPEREPVPAEPPIARGRASGMGTLACFEAALEDPTIDIDELEARRLCAGSLGEGPAACAAAALEELLISDFQAVELCQCARSLEPVRCYERALAQTTLSEFEIVRLCSPVWSGRLGAGCLPGGALVPPYP